jgi:hypothetical protein
MRKVEEDAFDDAYELLKKAEVGPLTHTPLAPLTPLPGLAHSSLDLVIRAPQARWVRRISSTLSD